MRVYEALLGIQEQEKHIADMMEKIPGMPADPVLAQRIKALDIVLQELPVNVAEMEV